MHMYSSEYEIRLMFATKRILWLPVVESLWLKTSSPAPRPSSTCIPTKPWIPEPSFLGSTRKDMDRVGIPGNSIVWALHEVLHTTTEVHWRGHMRSSVTDSIPKVWGSSIVSSPLVVPYLKFWPSWRLPRRNAVWMSKDLILVLVEAAYWKISDLESLPSVGESLANDSNCGSS